MTAFTPEQQRIIAAAQARANRDCAAAEAAAATIHAGRLQAARPGVEPTLIGSPRPPIAAGGAVDREETGPTHLGPPTAPAAPSDGERGGEAALTVPTLFDPPAARATDPATSHEAAARAALNVTFDAWLVLAAHVEAENGLTGDELADATGRKYESVGPRRKPLTTDGWLVGTEERRNRKGVWEATDKGRAAWEHAPADIRSSVQAALGERKAAILRGAA